MKQYTTPEQTAKLLKLGFEKPSSIASVEPIYGMGGISVVKAYTIGELVEILDGKATLEIDNVGGIWMVSMSIFDFTSAELIDCLFDACVKLKEEGVI